MFPRSLFDVTEEVSSILYNGACVKIKLGFLEVCFELRTNEFSTKKLYIKFISLKELKVEFWANEEVCVLEFEKLGNKLVYFIA
jgi:hypothetical protein